MNNDLEQFNEAHLKEMIDQDIYPAEGFCSTPNYWLNHLANIALTAKQAKPTFEEWMSNQSEKIEVDCGCVTTEAFYHWLKVAYESTPQPAHTEQVNSPMQPLHIDEFGTIRFKANAIVQHLLDVAKHVGVNMNTIAMEGFKPEDEMQFAQLIGYSLSGYGDLSYVTDESYEHASAAAPKPESE